MPLFIRRIQGHQFFNACRATRPNMGPGAMASRLAMYMHGFHF